MIELKNLSCSYDTTIILENISLCIPSHLSILGANGSGKSTLAKAICNLIEFDGEIYLESEEIRTLQLKRRAELISYIPPKLSIYDEYISLEEFVLQGRFIHKNAFLEYSNADKEKVKAHLELLGISHLAQSSVSSLSSGEQQLALISQALTQESKYIIFDEPTANLDPKNSQKIALIIKALKESHTILLITHDLQLAAFMESDVLFIKDTKAHYFSDGFFNDAKLSELYEIKFSSMVASYD